MLRQCGSEQVAIDDDPERPVGKSGIDAGLHALSRAELRQAQVHALDRRDHAVELRQLPVAHGEGNYIADGPTIARLEGEGRVIFRYASPDGMIDPNWNHNGAINAIAGIVNERGNVLGMMPHPERASEALMGGTDGMKIFDSLVRSLQGVSS